MREVKVQTIEIDCSPGTPRPDTYIAGILEGTGIEVKETKDRFLGNWTWHFPEVDSAVWAAAIPKFRDRIANLYNTGAIRYGSW